MESLHLERTLDTIPPPLPRQSDRRPKVRKKMFQDGPPYRVAQYVFCDTGDRLQLGIVTQADPPHYHITLEDGSTLDTKNQQAVLLPDWKGDIFVPRDPDPLAELKDKLITG